jgi:hypothetical protein
MLLYQGPLEWHYLHTKFHENLPSSSNVFSGGTHRQTETGDLISLLSFLESKLKNYQSQIHFKLFVSVSIPVAEEQIREYQFLPLFLLT